MAIQLKQQALNDIGFITATNEVPSTKTTKTRTTLVHQPEKIASGQRQALASDRTSTVR